MLLCGQSTNLRHASRHLIRRKYHKRGNGRDPESRWQSRRETEQMSPRLFKLWIMAAEGKHAFNMQTFISHRCSHPLRIHGAIKYYGVKFHKSPPKKKNLHFLRVLRIPNDCATCAFTNKLRPLLLRIYHFAYYIKLLSCLIQLIQINMQISAPCICWVPEHVQTHTPSHIHPSNRPHLLHLNYAAVQPMRPYSTSQLWDWLSFGALYACTSTPMWNGVRHQHACALT